MATFVVCTCCGTTQEIAAADQLPKLWRQTAAGLRCARCSVKEETADGTVGDILDEEVIYLNPEDVTIDEGFEDECAICRGPCQGH